MTKTGADNPNWRGGRRRGGQGQRYWLVYAPEHPAARQNAVLEHRLIVEQQLGRYLTSDEVVHHRNGDTLDNRAENLEVMAQSEHARLHYRESLWPHRYIRPAAARIFKTCDYCHIFFVVFGKKNARKRFCSRDCYMAYRHDVGGALQRGMAA